MCTKCISSFRPLVQSKIQTGCAPPTQRNPLGGSGPTLADPGSGVSSVSAEACLTQTHQEPPGWGDQIGFGVRGS